MDRIEALSQARQEFETRLGQVGDEQWDLPTPCSEWSVGDLVNHVLLGNRMSVQLLAGAAQQEVMAGLGDDLFGDGSGIVERFGELADQVHNGFAAPGGLDGTVDHPMGVIPRAQFVGFRIGDYGTHAWDLARAIGADEQLDPDLVQVMWNDLEPMAGMLAQSGMFGDGASTNIGDDAPLQTRLMDLAGRRP
ncbi:MAG: TIGR03086 family protein [Actinomycetia bacterium]|nr:TIGR03086 family protein [Actinomycetes bacterium]